MSTLPHICVDHEAVRCLGLDGVNADLIYNGRRYKVLEINSFYSVLHGKDKSILHYPTRDLNGLVVHDDAWS
jgi:hypothetical protein